MGISIPKRKFTATAVGRTFRRANCEKCGAHYRYVLSCEAEATAETPLAEPEDKAEQLAREEAAAGLSKKLAREVAPVPCPRCGWLQEDMVQRLRADLGGVADGVAVFALIGGGLFLPIFGLVWLGTWSSDAKEANVIVGRFMLGCLAALACGLIVLKINDWRRRRWDPNAGDRSERIVVGRENAALEAECDEARQAALLSAADKRQIFRLNHAHRNEKYFKAAVALVFGASMAYLLTLEMPLVVAAARTFSWPSVKGEVKNAVVRSEQRGEHRYHWPEVYCAYAVAGHDYRGRRYYIVRDDSVWIPNTNRIVEDLMRSRAAVVYYNPNAPEESVLSRGLPFWKAGAVMAITAGACGGLFLAWRFIRAAGRPLPFNYDQSTPEQQAANPVIQRLLTAAAVFIFFAGALVQFMVLLVPVLDSSAEASHKQAEAQKRLTAQIDAGMAEYWKRSAVLEKVEALAEEYDLSEDELEGILRGEWSAMHPKGGHEPWRARIGDDPYLWRVNVDWDVEAIRKRCETTESSTEREAANDH